MGFFRRLFKKIGAKASGKDYPIHDFSQKPVVVRITKKEQDKLYNMGFKKGMQQVKAADALRRGATFVDLKGLGTLKADDILRLALSRKEIREQKRRQELIEEKIRSRKGERASQIIADMTRRRIRKK
jgi:hypothetical protein